MNALKIIIISIFMAFILNISTAQIPYSNLSIKEQYDEVYKTHEKYANEIYIALGEPSEPGSNNYGVYESLLYMYETTKDKAYLYKFMKKAIEIIEDRGNDYYWFVCSDPSFPFNGRLTMILSHFTFLIYSDPVLYSTEIYNPSEYKDYTTFGDFASWVYHNVDLTLNEALTDNSVWLGECAGFSKNGDNDTISIGELNYQSPWACSLLYTYLTTLYAQNMGIGTENVNYGVKVIQLARLYFNEKVPYNLTKHEYNKIMKDYCTMDDYTPYHSVLHNPNNYSYYWWHNGWKLAKEGDYLGMEDIGHGALDILFPILYNKYAYIFEDHLTTGDYFTTDQMLHFRNTFTKNIYNANSNSYADKFYPAVDGTFGPIWVTSWNYVYFNSENYFKTAPVVMVWMPLYKFDGINSNAPTPNVYNILMDYYINDVIPNNTSYDIHHYSGKYFVGLRMSGFANIVSAQWDKECYSLTLKNRDVVYDQDFTARNNLIVEPMFPNTYDPTNTNSFADPIITTPDFIIEPGTTVNMVAGHSITLKPGFKAKQGSNFHAYINNSLYQTKQLEIDTIMNNTSQFNTMEKVDKIQNKISTIKIYPNPTKGDITIASTNQIISTITISNILGSILLQEQVNEMQTQINISYLQQGFYFIKITTETGESITQKIVKE